MQNRRRLACKIKNTLKLFGLKNIFFTEKDPPFYQKYQPKLSLSLIDGLGIISHELLFAYFRIYKAANLTTIASLYHAETGEIINTEKKSKQVKSNYYAHPSSLSFEQLKDFDHNYFKFTIVRNPYTRVLSAYKNKIVQNAAGKRDMVASFLGKEKGSDILFEDFLDYLENGGINQNAHWARQIDLLPMPLEKFDFIGNIENINEHLGYVLEMIFGAPKPIISRKHHSTNSNESVYILDSNVLSRIYSLYEADFDSFKYSKSLD